MENPKNFSGETMETEQQCPKFQSSEKSEIMESFGVNEEDVDRSLHFSEKAREEVSVKFQESGFGGGADLENLVSMDVFEGAIALMECSKKAHAELNQKKVRSSVRQLRILYLEVPKKQRNKKGKPVTTISTGDGYLKKFGNPNLKFSNSISLNTQPIEDKSKLESNSVPLKQCSGKGKTLTSAIAKVEKLGENVIADFENAISDLVVNFKRESIKRCRESEESAEENQKQSKKQKGETSTTFIRDVNAKLSEWGLIPPPNFPDDFKTLIQNMGGSEVKLLIQKIIFQTDLAKNNNRLQIPVSKVTENFLTETERKKLEGEGMDVLLVEPKLKLSTIHLKLWKMKNCQVYVFNQQWGEVVKGNETLKRNAVVQIWSFRTGAESRLCFAMVNVRKGDD